MILGRDELRRFGRSSKLWKGSFVAFASERRSMEPAEIAEDEDENDERGEERGAIGSLGGFSVQSLLSVLTPQGVAGGSNPDPPSRGRIARCKEKRVRK